MEPSTSTSTCKKKLDARKKKCKQSTNRRTENIVQFPTATEGRQRPQMLEASPNIHVRTRKTYFGRARSRVTIEIEPRPTVQGDLPSALISDAARKTTGVSVRGAWRCVRGFSECPKSPTADIQPGNMETLSDRRVFKSQKPVLFRLASTMSSSLKVS